MRRPSSLETFEAVWSIIYRTHYDTNFNGVNWLAIRDEFRPRAEAASPRELRFVLQEMLDRLGQSHMRILPREVVETIGGEAADARKPPAKTYSAPADPKRAQRPRAPAPAPAASPSEGHGDLGLSVRHIDGQMVVVDAEPNGPAALAGIRPGWIILAIGGQPLAELRQAIPSDVSPKQRSFLFWASTHRLLSGPAGSRVKVEFLNHADRRLTLELVRRTELGEPVKFGRLPTLFARLQEQELLTPRGGSVGLIRFNTFMIPVAGAFDRAIDHFRKSDGIIIDLRGNLGGIGGMVMGMAGHFVTQRLSLGTLKTRENELNFFANPRMVNTENVRVEPYDGPVAVLVDAISASTAELFAGGLQAIGRARIFGEPTTGQALPALFDELPNGDTLCHAYADFVTPNGLRIEGTGVTPDEYAPSSRTDLLAGRDPALDQAIRWIAEGGRKGPRL